MINDYYFFFKYIVRFISINKLILPFNTYSVISINKLILSFNLKDIDDIDDVQFYNYFYLFKFFFGRSSYLSKLNSSFNLGNWRYSFNILLVLNKKDIYHKLFFILNDLLPSIERSNILIGVFSSSLNIYYLVIKDFNIFGEKKTNLGLFFLKAFLNVKFFCTGVDIVSTKILLKNLKINF